MTAILLCGEGPHDVGQQDWNSRTGEEIYHEGWMQPLVRKVFTGEVTIGAKHLRELVLFPRPKALKPIPKGQRDKAAIARYVAGLEGYDAVVFMTDADTNLEAERQVKVNEIIEGFNIYPNNASGVACVPRSASECWLLSDQNAWKAIGLKASNNFPKMCPEDLWGVRDDPNGNHPKNAFSRVATDAGVENNRETRRHVCELSSLQIMRTRCPTSLEEFLREIEAIAKTKVEN